ncbi:uncharacterized protein LOC108805789 isoform X2 [Raphanus sativus]|uniref:Uncharacterized protein LOC108805789 isoform X2 n=1 Tax=Raphanus sativus TaxID=3726 RepID=A0A6J0JCA3_RAPSA|nr:uncharacterized protein LOC108805789 isoform X2 [Raphanus sativus]
MKNRNKHKELLFCPLIKARTLLFLLYISCDFPRLQRVSFQLHSMEIEVSSSTHDSSNPVVELDSIRVKRKTLQNLLEDCQRALELLNLTETGPTRGSQEEDNNSDSPEMEEEEFSSSSDQEDPETDKLYDLIKSRVEGHDFREKIEFAQVSLLQDLPDGSSWDVVSEDDYVWGEGQTEDDYVLVREEDIADGIVCFMATYLSSLNQTKDIT